METKTRDGRISPALVWTAGIAIIVFCAAGAAAFMGWLPSSVASPEGIGSETAKPAPKAHAAVPAAPVQHAAARPAPVVPVAPVAPAQRAAAPACIDCGVVESVAEVA